MIEFISGILIEKKPNFIVVDVNGVGYKIFISLNSYDELPKVNNKVSINTFFQVSENNQCLYGFKDLLEKEIFLMLIGVSGIGPKTGIALLSAVKPLDLKQRLIAGEVKMLTSLPGVGIKTAKRIIIELKDKFTKTNKDDLPIENSNDNTDAYYALINLGFRSNNVRDIINKIVKDNPQIDTEDIIKESLKKLR